MKVQGKFKTQAHFLSCVVMDIAAFKVSHSSGTDIDATALRVVRARGQAPYGRWRKFLGRFRMQALTRCDAEVVSTRTQQSVSSRVSSVGRWMKVQGMFKRQTHSLLNVHSINLRTTKAHSQFNGALDERSRTVQKANTL